MSGIIWNTLTCIVQITRLQTRCDLCIYWSFIRPHPENDISVNMLDLAGMQGLYSARLSLRMDCILEPRCLCIVCFIWYSNWEIVLHALEVNYRRK